MKPVKSFIVTAHLPQRIEKLKELAYNYWWCWNSTAKELFLRIDRKLWEEVDHNPVLLLNRMTQKQLEELSQKSDFTSFLDYIHKNFRKYMEEETWYERVSSKQKDVIAYFSMEYGINESFPNYSGGLGVLSGDHLKSASDLGLPLIGIGLLYQMGYFRQTLTQSGWQNERYIFNDFDTMPLTLLRNDNGEPFLIDVDLPKGKAFAQIWVLQLGRVPLYLIDTNIQQNSDPEYRDITDQLYGGTRDTRIQQEIFLGIGGVKMMKALGINATVYHINEGHAAFALMERSRNYMEQYGVDFATAKQITKTSSVFTTHTPVPAGNEVFSTARMDGYFTNYIKSFGISREEFYSLGQERGFDNNAGFSLTILGLKLTSFHNGVSKLHGEVARKMWQNIWKCFPENEVPIGSVTNGIHTTTWVARELSELYDRYLSYAWRKETDNPNIWADIDNIPNEELWREKQRRRVRLVLFARDHLKKNRLNLLMPEQLNKINEFLNPDALTIGFARRFATYKRALLLFSDMSRLKRILTDAARPVQVIIAGKAHPHDTQGKEVIQSIIHKVREFGIEKHVVFLEDYDMVIARFMVKGCDVWLNNPIRPLEASGTSGMKAGLNGTLNLSILDGWWDEAYDGTNGFAIGHGEEYENQQDQDLIEASSLYDVLEQLVVPLFYNRGGINKVPEKWVGYMKRSIQSVACLYSTNRMVKDYTKRYYFPAANFYHTMIENKAANAIALKNWKHKIRNEWSSVQVIEADSIKDSEPHLGKPIKVSSTVDLGNLSPNDVVVQVYYGTVNPHDQLINTGVEELYLKTTEGRLHYYEGSYLCPENGKQGFTVRVLPRHPHLANSAELYICSWASEF